MAIKTDLSKEVRVAHEAFAVRDRLLADEADLEARLVDVRVRLLEAERSIDAQIDEIRAKVSAKVR